MRFGAALYLLLSACSATPTPSAIRLPCPAPSASAQPSASAAACFEPQRAPAAPAAPVVPSPQSEPRVIELWPEGVPGLLADAPPERIEDERVYNVSVATLTAFPAPKPDARKTAVIVCPGGAYVRLAV